MQFASYHEWRKDFLVCILTFQNHTYVPMTGGTILAGVVSTGIAVYPVGH
jgi:hypothetical protein